MRSKDKIRDEIQNSNYIKGINQNTAPKNWRNPSVICYTGYDIFSLNVGRIIFKTRVEKCKKPSLGY